MDHAIYLQQYALKALGYYHGALDGDEGPATRAAFAAWLGGASKASGVASDLAGVAIAEVGVKEEGNNGGAKVREYQKATWLEPGAWPWCAAFVCWCLAHLVKKPAFSLPQTAGAWDFENWARDNAGKGVRLIKPAAESVREGDIVVFNFSHIGIAVADEAGGMIKTVEGNTNADGDREGDGVYRKTRKKALVRSIIRLA